MTATSPPLADQAQGPPLCVEGISFITSTDVRLITSPNAATFASIDARLTTLSSTAPDPFLEAELRTLRDGFAVIGDAYAATGFDPNATVSLPSEVLTANAIAAERLERFLLESCGLEAARDRQIDDIVLAFALEDRAVAECLHTQLGDIANIEASGLTPALLTAPVCETSLIGLLSGQGASGS